MFRTEVHIRGVDQTSEKDTDDDSTNSQGVLFQRHALERREGYESVRDRFAFLVGVVFQAADRDRLVEGSFFVRVADDLAAQIGHSSGHGMGKGLMVFCADLLLGHGGLLVVEDAHFGVGLPDGRSRMELRAGGKELPWVLWAGLCTPRPRVSARDKLLATPP